MPEFKLIDVAETPYLYTERTCSMDPGDISRTMGEAFGAVWAHMEAKKVAPTGAALSVYYGYDPEKMTFRAGFSIKRDDMDKAGGDIRADVTPAGQVLHFVHKGPYRTLRDDYGLMMKYAEEKGLKIGAPTWEIYVNDLDQVTEDELVTEVFSALG